MSSEHSETTTSEAEPEAAATIRKTAARVTDLETADGEFCVVCSETGICPDPVTGRCFDSYEDAETACAAAEAYRDALRALDPTLAEYDLVVSRPEDGSLQFAAAREVVDHDRPHGLPRSESTVTVAGDGYEEYLHVENAPVVHLSGPDSPLDDELVERQLDTKL